MTRGAYSRVADAQLDDIEQRGGAALYNAVLDACELVFSDPATARRASAAITAREGMRLVLPVLGHSPVKVFWSSEGPRIEAVFP